MATIQTKLTSDNKQHDEAFKRSKQEVYNYQKRVDTAKVGIKNFAGGITSKLIPALGLAGGAMGVFNKLLENNDVLADKVNSKMEGLKASVNAFARECTSFNSSSFISKLKDIKNTAEETYYALDNLGTFNTAYSYTNQKKMAEVASLREKKAAGTLTQDDIKRAKALKKELEDENKTQLELQSKVVSSLLNQFRANLGYSKGESPNSSGNYAKQLGNVDLINIILDAAMDNIDFNDMKRKWKYNAKMSDFYTYLQTFLLDKELFVSLMEALQSRENIKMNTANASRTIDKIINSDNTSSSSSSSSSNNSVPDFITSNKFSTSGDGASIFTIGEAITDATISTNLLTNATDRYATSLENVLDTANELFPTLSENLSEISDLVSNLSSGFSNLGDMFNSKELNIAGIISQTIANLLLSYSKALGEASALTPIGWATFAAGGFAQVTAMIAQIHNLTGYANGGIIGGNSYVGDKMLARVNSGEMILNHSQQANLFDMINSGGLGGGNVQFHISGSDLVGVINNYNKKTGRVR